MGHDKTIKVLKEEKELFRERFLLIQESYENKIMELSLLKELNKMLLSSELQNSSRFWNTIFDLIEKYTSVGNISIMMLKNNGNRLVKLASTGSTIAESYFTQSENKKKLITEIKSKRSAFVLKNIKISGGEEKKMSGLLIPITIKKKRGGVLSLWDEDPGCFSKEKIRFFSLVADHISTAITFRQVYEKMLEEEKSRNILSRFFSETVTNKILKSKGKLELGGERKNVTVLFADLKGFTSLSEILKPEKVVEILNSYFSAITPIVFKNDGTMDKLMGDCILALFGAPISFGKDAQSAVQAAVEILVALEKFNKKNKHKGWPELTVSIGINSGDVIAGYLGSESHMNYTVIGDVVNVAQRIQATGKKNEILITGSVREEIHNSEFKIIGFKGLKKLKPKKLKGKEKIVDIYSVITEPS